MGAGGLAGFPSRIAAYAYYDLLVINLWWGLLNLLPIWPLDGGQMAGVLLSMINPAQGMRWTHIVSLVAAGCLAMWVFQRDQLFLALWFIMFAMMNFGPPKPSMRRRGTAIPLRRMRTGGSTSGDRGLSFVDRSPIMLATRGPITGPLPPLAST